MEGCSRLCAQVVRSLISDTANGNDPHEAAAVRHGETRNEAVHVDQLSNVRLLEGLVRERRDRQRRLLKRGFLLLAGDNDIACGGFQFGASRFGGRHGG